MNSTSSSKWKITGIILIVIAGLNMIAWIPALSKGKSEGALYYIFIIALLVLGIWLSTSNNANRKR